MAGPVPSVSGVTPLGEGQDRRVNLAVRRRLLGPWRFLTLATFLGASAAWLAAVALLAVYRLGDLALELSWVAYAVVAVVGAFLARRGVARIGLARWRARGLPAQQLVTYSVEPEALVVAGEAAVIRVLWPYVSEIAPAGRYWVLPAAGQSYFLPRRFLRPRRRRSTS